MTTRRQINNNNNNCSKGRCDSLTFCNSNPKMVPLLCE